MAPVHTPMRSDSAVDTRLAFGARATLAPTAWFRHLGLERYLLVVLTLLGLTGVVMVLISTRWGVGITPDSTVYVGSARSLLAGDGLSVPFVWGETTALTLHAPLFPTLLAGLGIFGLDPVHGARWLNAVLFGANILLVGYVLYHVTGGSSLTAVFGSVLVLTSVDMLTFHSMAMTEALFFLVSLLGVFLLARSFERPRLLPVSAAFVAASALTRYPGVALIGVGLVALVAFDPHAPYGRRLQKAAIFAVISALPIGLWVLRNLYVGGSAGGRELAFHPITVQHIASGLLTMSAWVVPARIPGVPAAMRDTVLLGVLAAGLALGVLLARQGRGSGGVSGQPYRIFPALLGLFVVSYACVLIVNISFLDQWRGPRGGGLDRRIMSVFFLPMVLLVLLKGQGLLRAARRTGWVRGAALLACLLVGSSYLARGTVAVARNYADGVEGYTDRLWRESEAVAWVRSLPADVRVYSNGADAIYILTGRPAERIPVRVRPMSGFVNANLPRQLAMMEEQLQSGRAVLIYFHTITHRWYLPSETELRAALSLRLVQHTADAAVYAGRAP